MINDLEDLKVDTCQVDADGKTLETFNVPDADGQAVAGSCREDLDEELVSRYITAVRETTPRLVNENDTDVLYYWRRRRPRGHRAHGGWPICVR